METLRRLADTRCHVAGLALFRRVPAGLNLTPGALFSHVLVFADAFIVVNALNAHL
jgi:hypothetical protein